MRTFVTSAITAALLTSLTASRATPQKPLQFGSSAELVLIDLVATDGDGRRITDLRPEDVEIYEGGKRQRLEVLSFVGNPNGAGTAIPRVAPSPAPASEAAPDRTAGQSAPSRLVVVVDQGAMPSELLVPVRAAIVSMVRENLDPETELMLVTFNRGLQVRMPFTTDPARFIAAVEVLRPSASGAELAMSDLMEQVERMCDGTPNADKNAVGVARAFVDDVRQGLTNATEGIGALSRYLAPIPGRKHIVFYSAGYPVGDVRFNSMLLTEPSTVTVSPRLATLRPTSILTSVSALILTVVENEVKPESSARTV